MLVLLRTRFYVEPEGRTDVPKILKKLLSNALNGKPLTGKGQNNKYRQVKSEKKRSKRI
jgi:hypothetical protein